MTTLPERKKLLGYFKEAVKNGARKAEASRIMGLSLRTLQRWQQPETIQVDGRSLRTAPPAHKLDESERKEIVSTANTEEFKNTSPHQIVPVLAERGKYIGSESSFYRILREENQIKHRQASQVKKPHNKPKALKATAPNQIYSWDITYLATRVLGQFFYLYLFMDIFSRKIVGWQVYREQSSNNASDLIIDICKQEQIQQEQLTLHSDNGSPMKGATMLSTLQKLGVIPSLSRPAVSNDNPYSESLFKTLKYCPKYPKQAFEDLDAARSWVTEFVQWYNQEHHHSGIKWVTPEQRHKGKDQAILIKRQATYEAAKAKNPARWSHQGIRNWEWQSEVNLNPDKVDHIKTNNIH
jgi:transposase InsO family protein